MLYIIISLCYSKATIYWRRTQMTKKTRRTMCAVLLTVVLLMSMLPAAYAVSNTHSVKVQPGDTLTSICGRAGLDYTTHKYLIMRLNNFTSEVELDDLRVGDSLIIPNSASYGGKHPAVSDKLAYFIINYKIEKGDNLGYIYNCWGMNASKYHSTISALNHVNNLDKLYIGWLMKLPCNQPLGDDFIPVNTHVVTRGESAYGICTSYGLDYNAIEELLEDVNPGLKLSKLAIGDKLNIPIVLDYSILE